MEVVRDAEEAGFDDSFETKPLEVMILERSKLLQVHSTPDRGRNCVQEVSLLDFVKVFTEGI